MKQFADDYEGSMKAYDKVAINNDARLGHIITHQRSAARGNTA